MMITHSLYTKSLGEEIAKLAKPSSPRKYYIIFSTKGKWMVVSEGSVRPQRTFATQRAAIAYARKSAMDKSFREVVVHAKDGELVKRIKV